jgi:predicted DsbA family dithiol-disulfide isomerase
MRIEVWSDVVCPWCYIGKRRLETALARFPHADRAQVTWRSFQLDPTVPVGHTEPTLPMLAAKYRTTEENVLASMRSIEQLAAAEGLAYDLPSGVTGNTQLAHQLIHLANAHGLGGEMKERLLHAHFEQGRSVFDVESLVPLAVEVGLAGDEARAALTDGRYLADVRADIATARTLGVTGVPFFVVDRAYGASGAQDPAVLLQLLERAWADSHPLTTVPAADGCDDGTCAV